MILIRQVQEGAKHRIFIREQNIQEQDQKQSMRIKSKSNKGNESPSGHTWNAFLKPGVFSLPTFLFFFSSHNPSSVTLAIPPALGQRRPLIHSMFLPSPSEAPTTVMAMVTSSPTRPMLLAVSSMGSSSLQK